MAFGLALLAASDVVLSTALSELVYPTHGLPPFSLAAKLKKRLSMGRIPDELRQIIAANIRAERMKKYPGRGGGKKCAEAFGVSPQQWSPWERGMRTPDELRLSQIAEFFGVTVDYMRHDHSVPPNVTPPHPSGTRYPEPSLNGMTRDEGEILCQLQKEIFGEASNKIHLQVSLYIVVSKKEEKESIICSK